MQGQSQIYEIAAVEGAVQVNHASQLQMARDVLEGMAYLVRGKEETKPKKKKKRRKEKLLLALCGV